MRYARAKPRISTSLGHGQLARRVKNRLQCRPYSNHHTSPKSRVSIHVTTTVVALLDVCYWELYKMARQLFEQNLISSYAFLYAPVCD